MPVMSGLSNGFQKLANMIKQRLSPVPSMIMFLCLCLWSLTIFPALHCEFGLVIAGYASVEAEYIEQIEIEEDNDFLSRTMNDLLSGATNWAKHFTAREDFHSACLHPILPPPKTA